MNVLLGQNWIQSCTKEVGIVYLAPCISPNCDGKYISHFSEKYR